MLDRILSLGPNTEAPYLSAGANFIHDKLANELSSGRKFRGAPLRFEGRFLMTSQLPSSQDKLTSAWQDSERPIEKRMR